MCFAGKADQNGSAHEVLCRLSKDKMQFACSLFVVAVLFGSRSGFAWSSFVNGFTDREAPHKWSIESLDERKVRAVAFTTSTFIQCFSAEQLLDTCKQSRQKFNNTCGGCGMGIWCRQQVFDPETNHRRFDRLV